MKANQRTQDPRATADAALFHHGRTFYWARRLLGAEHAERATRLYGFCRYLDDIADQADFAQEAQIKLQAISEEIAAGQSADAVIEDGIRLMAECQMEPGIAQELISGLLSDLAPVRIADEAGLIRYCYRVAGTVGLMMCGALDVHCQAAYSHAVDLGIAMQLTNICRDVAEDGAAGRRYLPASLVGEIEPHELANPPSALRPALRNAVATLLECARQYYQSGEDGLGYLPFRARMAILVAGRVYREIGTRLGERDFAYWNGRVVVPDRAKAVISARALWSAAWSASLSRRARVGHDCRLHSALAGLPLIGDAHAS